MNRAGISNKNIFMNNIKNKRGVISNVGLMKIKINNNIIQIYYENGKNVKYLYDKLIMINYLVIIILILNILILNCLLLSKVSIWYYVYIILNFSNFAVLLCYEKINFEYYKNKLLINKFKSYLKIYFFNDKFFYFFFVFIIFPLDYFEKFSYELYDPVLKIYLQYNLNDILYILNVFKFYYLIIYIIKATIFYNHRTERINKLFQNQISIFFAYKCIYRKNTVYVSIITLFYFITIYTYLINLFEKPYQIEIMKSFKLNFSNYFWLNFISLSQVGYGDLSPFTFMGRFIIILNCFTGFILISTILIGYLNELKIKNQENVCYNFLKNINLKYSYINKIKKLSKKLIFKEIWKKKLFLKSSLKNNENKIFNLKKKLNFYINKKSKINCNYGKNIILDLDYFLRNFNEEWNEIIDFLYQKRYFKRDQKIFKKLKINFTEKLSFDSLE